MNEDFMQLVQSHYSQESEYSTLLSEKMKLIFIEDYLLRISLMRYFFAITAG
jgi:hypothetical protein